MKKIRIILVIIFSIFILLILYRAYAFSRVNGILSDFTSVIHGSTVKNEMNGEHLQRYYPHEKFIYTHFSCDNVIIIGNSGRMYMRIYGKNIVNTDGIITTIDYFDTFSMDIEKVSGKWQIKKVNFQP